jgi:hypothetical protein
MIWHCSEFSNFIVLLLVLDKNNCWELKFPLLTRLFSPTKRLTKNLYQVLPKKKKKKKKLTSKWRNFLSEKVSATKTLHKTKKCFSVLLHKRWKAKQYSIEFVDWRTAINHDDFVREVLVEYEYEKILSYIAHIKDEIKEAVFKLKLWFKNHEAQENN